MKKTIIFIIFAIFSQSCVNKTKKNNQDKLIKPSEGITTSTPIIELGTPINLSINEIPREIQFEGKIKKAIKWSDKLGENIVITTETGIYESVKFKHENNGGDAELFAYHFKKSNGIFKQTWRVYDFISDCPVDIVAEYIDDTFQITDLNNNGIAEIWLMYKTVCHGDVSPSDMKIIMYEGSQKYAIRGENKVIHGIDDNGNKLYFGGEYTFDKSFSNGPIEFLEFAKKMWDKNIMENWK
nr:hypothetical protein [uncultured Flavobacterium sp.]